MRNSVVLILLLASPAVMAAQNFKISPKKEDLFSESQTLAVQNEQSIQENGGRAQVWRVGLSAGTMTVGAVSIAGTKKSQSYGEKMAVPMAGVRMERHLAGSSARLNLDGEAAYGMTESDRKYRTILHTVPVSLGLSLRFGDQASWWMRPEAGVGIEQIVYVQRGIEEMETRGADSANYAQAGVAVPLFAANEFALRYRRLFAATDSGRDWNGEAILVNGSVNF